MEQVYFSANMLGFIPAEWKEDGTYTADSWPADAVLLTDEESSAYWKQIPPVGKILSGVAGRPVWIDIPAPTHDELVTVADAQKSSLLQDVNSKTQLWQTQLMLGIITAADKATLTTWMTYVQAVQAVDTSAAPNITWPTPPAETTN